MAGPDWGRQRRERSNALRWRAHHRLATQCRELTGLAGGAAGSPVGCRRTGGVLHAGAGRTLRRAGSGAELWLWVSAVPTGQHGSRAVPGVTCHRLASYRQATTIPRLCQLQLFSVHSRWLLFRHPARDPRQRDHWAHFDAIRRVRCRAGRPARQ